jgi:stage II sporulation protein D
METFRQAAERPFGGSATVTAVGRLALRLGAVALFALGGLASTILAAHAPGATSTGAATTGALVTSPAPAVVAFSGHGWGHGLGMSQWGAYGYAQHGWTYDRILAHYYTGTTLGRAKLTTVRVLLAEAKKPTVGSAVAWSVTDAAGAKVALAAGQLVLKPKLALAGHPELQPPLTFAAKEPLTLDGHPYRGRLVVSSDGKRVQVIDVVGLESYLKGVVPAEMPANWPPEALKAQAVAARSYALANLTKGRAFDLYGDTRSQVYGGIDAESPAASAAVDATKGEVVLYAGKVANTWFFSTSGGRTASSLEAMGTLIPYLMPVADPYDSLSPYHDWGPVLFDAAKAAKAMRVPAPIADLQTTTGPSGRVKAMTIVSGDDSQLTLSGNAVRAALELRSTWFTASLLQLAPAAKAMTYGGAVSLTGVAKNVDRLALESRPAGGAWAAAGELILGADGSFATVVKPQAATQYRLAWGDVRAGLARISVAPRVSAQPATQGVRGAEVPALAGAAVQLQRQDGAAWSTVSTTTADAGGAYGFTGPLQAGTYRVRCAPGHGLVPGLSATFTVA